jgi:hypothetical protein
METKVLKKSTHTFYGQQIFPENRVAYEITCINMV